MQKNNITNTNCQRRKLIDFKRIKEYETQNSLYKLEEQDAVLNKSCENKFVSFLIKSMQALLVQYHNQNNIDYSYHHLTEQLLIESMLNVYKDEPFAFVCVKSHCCICQGKVCYTNIPKHKPGLVKHCIELKAAPYSD